MSRQLSNLTRLALGLAMAGLVACTTATSEGARPDDAAPTGARVKALACEEANLALPDDHVVATVNGVAVKAKDLGEELAREEQKALRTYCSTVSEARSMALENHVNETLLKAAAEKAGQTPEELVKGRVEAAMSQRPSDEALLEFYNANKSPSAPPFEVVKDQVAMAMQRDAAQTAVMSLIDELRAGAEVKLQLPDVSPPALNIDVPVHTATKGGANAKVTVVEFADFECPYCSRAADTMNAVKAKYGDKIRIAYRHFPLSFHPNARRAAEYSQCAQAQGKFWGFHDKAYEAKDGLGEDALKTYATEAGLDAAALETCLNDGSAAKQVDEDMAKAREVGVEGTPTFFINGKPFLGNPSPDGIGAAIDAILGS